MIDIPKVEEFLQLNIFPYDIDFGDGELIAELCRRSIQTFERASNFCDTIFTFATSTTSTHCSKPSGVVSVTNFSQRRGIWYDIWLIVAIVLNIFTKKCLRTEKNIF